MIYPPREDSLLLAKWVKKLARGKVLDMGTGSGIQAQTSAAKKSVQSVLAVDVDPAVIAHCRKSVASKKITCVQSDLFAKVPAYQFDTIIFNPPYLPQELPERDIALEGGKQGFETIRDFLYAANPYLAADGTILLLFSSLSKKHEVEQAIQQNLFEFVELDRLHIFFEDLYVYKITKSSLLKRIERSSIKNALYFARGKRSWVYRGTYRGRHCVVKVKRPDSAVDVPAKESRMLRAVNKLGLGPRLFRAHKDFAVYEWVPGSYLKTELEHANKKLKRSLFRQLFEQAFVLDQAGLTKEEMLRPLRNAIVTARKKVVLIDFERTHRTEKPHNVTQLCTFAAKEGIAPLKAIKHWAAHYKRQPTRAAFAALLDGIGL